ncbi:DUF1778 domain-containing protein [Haloferula chungangensis]|uniref:DUF1778 domain-containing protein n=1 Tax=Haloferula chungangensis TaxID=1048331 RepID=A0ABW2L6C0_9BACT
MNLELWYKKVHIDRVSAPPSKTTKVERLVARVSPDDKRTIERAAALTGQSVASFVIAHARDAAEKAVERHERIKLNAADSSRFVEALLAPARKVPRAVKDAFEDYRATVTEA